MRVTVLAYTPEPERTVAAAARLCYSTDGADELLENLTPEKTQRFLGSLLNFFRLRCCNRAQWEIRSLAEAIYMEVKKIAPTLFANAGPACVTEGSCPEGGMTCGQMGAVREKYKSMEK